MIGVHFGKGAGCTNEQLSVLEELLDLKRALAANEPTLDIAACELRGLLRRPEDESRAA